MNLKMKQMALLMVGLITSATVLSAPVTFQDIESAQTNGQIEQAWISGASAPTYVVYEGWASGCDVVNGVTTNTIFTTGTVRDVADARPGKLRNQMAYACKRAGKISVLYHTIDGGSLNAFTPHTATPVTAMPRVKFVGLQSGCNTPVNFVDATNSKNNAQVFQNCTRTGVAVPDTGATTTSNSTTNQALIDDPKGPRWPVGGFSDVEAEFFSPTIGGGNPLSKGDQLNVGVGQVFGLAVSIPLYRALQLEQNLDPTSDTIADAPNVTSGQYAYLIAPGVSFDWGSLLTGARATGKTVNVFRRVDTSGSQGSSNAFFLRQPCNDAVKQSLAPRTELQTNLLTDFKIKEWSSSTDLAAALTALASSTNGAVSHAIGVLSLENRSGLTTYRYVKLDGVHPEDGDPINARLTATNGDYKFHMELKSFERKDNNPGRLPKVGLERTIISDLTLALQNPLIESCSVFPRGLTLNPGNNSVCTVQTAKMTNFGQNCATAVRYF